MIAKISVPISVMKEINVDMDAVFDKLAEIYLENVEAKNKPAFNRALTYLKKQNWNELKFPQDVDDVLDVRWDYPVCQTCPYYKHPDDDPICNHYNYCGAGLQLFNFIEIVEEYGEKLIEECEVKQ